MRFFFEFVSCYGSGSGSRRSTPPREADTTSVALASQPRQSRNSRKRGRAAALRSKSAAEWRPSLHSISEDNIAPERAQRTLAGSERMIKRKVGSATTTPAGVHVRRYSDDFGSSGFPAIIPAFSPTPLFF